MLFYQRETLGDSPSTHKQWKERFCNPESEDSYGGALPREWDAVIVLGASVRPDGKPSPALLRRTLEAIRQFKAGGAGILILSGGLGRFPPAESFVMRDICLDHGLSPEHLLLDSESRTTMDSAFACLGLAQQHGLRSFLIVSDPYHLRRAVMTFRFIGLRSRGHPAKGGREANPAWKWTYFHVREYVATLWYLWLLLLFRTGLYRQNHRIGHQGIDAEH
jgi:uncharacterized SAM-binding protein YcdF (DUF218 family)